jgi:hypothetical protein
MATEAKKNGRAVPKQPLSAEVIKAIKADLAAALNLPRKRKARDAAAIPVRVCRWEPIAAEMERLYRCGHEYQEIAAIVARHVPDVTDAAINAALRRYRDKQQSIQASQRRAA